jgi:hypothetical protein
VDRGQTWSTFADPEAEPDGIDFEGLNAISLFRQPQVRFTHKLAERIGLALALENPSPDITGASGVSQVPDLIARVRWTPGEHGLLGLNRTGSHVHTALSCGSFGASRPTSRTRRCPASASAST